MKKQRVIILKGLPASGKTTYAKDLVANSNGKMKRVNKDDIRAMYDNGKWSKEREASIVKIRNHMIIRALDDGYDVIVDDTNLHPKHERDIRELVLGLCAGNDKKIEVVVDSLFLDVPLRECIRRDALRSNSVGRDVINRMARSFDVGVPKPYFIEGLPSCVICDLDGTLALMGKRNPFDASKCEDDLLNHSVANFVQFLSLQYPIFYFSGRQEKDRDPTERWLAKHSISFHEKLVMRPTASMEKDVFVKEVMFEQHIRGKYNVHVVLDDRDQCVHLWRDLGLTCFQVADGNF